MPRSNVPDLEPLLNRRVRVALRGSHELVGVLEGYDAHANISLAGIENAPGYSEGMVRGDTICSIKECSKPMD